VIPNAADGVKLFTLLSSIFGKLTLTAEQLERLTDRLKRVTSIAARGSEQQPERLSSLSLALRTDMVFVGSLGFIHDQTRILGGSKKYIVFRRRPI